MTEQHELGSTREPAASLVIRPGLLYLILAIAAIGVMLPSVFGPFIFDDQPLILGNHYIHSFEHWRRWLEGGLWDTNYDPTEGGGQRGYWRPVILASYAWDWLIGGGSPVVFHVTNLAVHAANVVLLFAVLQRWCRSDFGALVGALLFAVHPVQTEPVAWIAGRTDSLCVLGMLMVTLGVRAHRERRAWLRNALLVFGVVLAFGSKEAAITLPALAVVEDWSSECRPLTWSVMLALVRRALPFVGLVFALLWIRHFTVQDPPDDFGLSASNRVPLVFEALGRYAALVVWPLDTTLGQANFFFEQRLYYRVVWPFVGLGAVALASVLGFAFWARLTKPRAALAGLLILGLIFPVSGAVWLGYPVLVSPRFLYVPMIGVAFAAGLLSSVLAQRFRWVVAAAVVGASLLVLSTLTFVRAGDYSSEQGFWRAEIERNPHYQPAQLYFIVRELREQRTTMALRLSRHFFVTNSEAGFPNIYNSGLVMRIVEGVLQITPDADRAALVEVERFSAALAAGKPAALALPERGLDFVVPQDPLMLSSLRSQRRLFLLLAAEAASRSGNDAAARGYASELIVGCEKCWTLLSSVALAQARAGDLEGAVHNAKVAVQFGPPGRADTLLQTLTSAWQLYSALALSREGPQVSMYYASLGAFGRAYDAAKSAIDNPPSDAASRFALAELSVRAGYVADARRLVGLSDAEFAHWFDAIDPPVRWRDLAPDPDVWVPETPEL